MTLDVLRMASRRPVLKGVITGGGLRVLRGRLSVNAAQFRETARYQFQPFQLLRQIANPLWLGPCEKH